MAKSYYIPSTSLEVLTEVKKSRFFARATMVATRDEAMSFIDVAKKDYPDARHHCWAYFLGNPSSASSAAMNDDGEPGGTAGKPILNVIQHKDIGDVIVVVTRYFGGVKLGAGGLTRAYSGAAESVLSSLPLIEQIPLVNVVISCDFSQEQLIRHWATQWQATVVKIEYGEGVEIELSLPEVSLGKVEKFCIANSVALKEKKD